MRPFTLSIALLSVVVAAASSPGTTPSSTTIYATPHDSYSSSVGVLGCKIDTNRVAYFPSPVSCTNICISLTHPSGRSLKLLRIDQSGGAHDISYDAWNYLSTGYSARDKPETGGAVEMQYRDLPPEECKGLIKTREGRLPLSASNSMNFLASCLGESGSWVGGNYVLFNIADAVCTWGVDETCDLEWPERNMAECRSGLGRQVVLEGKSVVNVQYGTGKLVKAAAVGQGVEVGKNGIGRSFRLGEGLSRIRWLIVVLVVFRW
ncbi:hypothetical protein GQ43DRAFT_385342 [Delitschia confertaspora ATCC 74209]|uniref:Ecp2 effector protein domain-containing protein n=1 Tax=Delitschia confertaspora ATCC 74209 TaxID=1513339 RepID=A0A9P4JTV7_9PLEO|nr:hypothetical protein GQ43DRAFT_385342 [Delitschia confertaspora ATCC 74209]